MRKIIASGEFRELVGKAVCIALSGAMCIICILMQNIFAVLISLVLMAILCVGLGYTYCKNEAVLTALIAEKEMADVEVPSFDCAEKVEEKSFESVDNEE